MNIVINNVDFWDGFDAAKYWTIPTSHSAEKRKEEVKNCVLSGNYLGSWKHDGIWAMIIKDLDGQFHLRSRTQNVEKTYADKVDWIPHITSELSAIPNGTVLLGEIYKKGDEGSRKATAILNCLKEKSLQRQKETPLTFYCFDVLAYNGKALLDTPIEIRINKYLNRELKNSLTGNYVEAAIYYEGEELWEKLYEILNAGYEGMVIQKKSAKYLCGKRKAWDSIKLKKELQDTIDAFLDGSYKEPTKLYSGKEIETWTMWYNEKTNENLSLGSHYDEYLAGAPIIPVTKPFYNKWASAVSFSVMKDNKPIHLGWISGISDKLKEEIISTPEKWVGKVAALNAMEIENIDGEYSLRHGKIERWRDDKVASDCDFSQIESSVK